SLVSCWTFHAVDASGPKNRARMSLSMPTTDRPSPAKCRTASDPMRPADPVMTTTLTYQPLTRCFAPATGRKTEGPVDLTGPRVVGKEGVEPSRPYGHTDLNRARLPFRHFPEWSEGNHTTAPSGARGTIPPAPSGARGRIPPR